MAVQSFVHPILLLFLPPFLTSVHNLPFPSHISTLILKPDPAQDEDTG